jgi:tetratricopeptide (TPR) repeat protein
MSVHIPGKGQPKMTRSEQREDASREKLVDAALNLYIQKIERENAEGKTWIRQPNNLISVVAIVLSFLSVAYGLRKDYYDGIDKDLQSLSANVSDLTKLDSDMLTAAATDPARTTNLELVLNNRRVALLAEADRLINHLGDRAPRAQLAVLGPAYVQVNDYQKAEKYFELLTKPPSSPTMQLEAWRSLAITFSLKGPEFSEKARAAFRNATQIFSNPEDVGSLALIMNVYEQWAQFEIGVSNFSLALQRLRDARLAADRLPCPTMRPAAVARLDGEVQQAITSFRNLDPEGASSAKLELTTNSNVNVCQR